MIPGFHKRIGLVSLYSSMGWQGTEFHSLGMVPRSALGALSG